MAYSPTNYYSLGRVYPRNTVREPFYIKRRVLNPALFAQKIHKLSSSSSPFLKIPGLSSSSSLFIKGLGLSSSSSPFLKIPGLSSSSSAFLKGFGLSSSSSVFLKGIGRSSSSSPAAIIALSSSSSFAPIFQVTKLSSSSLFLAGLKLVSSSSSKFFPSFVLSSSSLKFLPDQQLSLSSSFGLPGGPLGLPSGDRAFSKACAPDNLPIAPYALVDDCFFPVAPEPITTPTETPPPIPPIDEGCYALSLRGTFHGPSDPNTPVGGSIGTNITYPTGDFCEPDINIDVFIPCTVTFSNAFIDVEFNPLFNSAAGVISTIDTGNCDLGISLSIGLPCPTFLFGGSGLADFDNLLPPGQGQTVLIASPRLGTCDFDLGVNFSLPCPGTTLGGRGTVAYDTRAPIATGGVLFLTATKTGNQCDVSLSLDLSLPCPGTVTAKANTMVLANVPCVAKGREPRVEFGVIAPSSRIPGCNTNLELILQVPCPIKWAAPKVKINIPAGAGKPSGKIGILPSSSACDKECNPKFTLTLSIPCPVHIVGLGSAITITTGSHFAWAQTPTGIFSVVQGGHSGSGANAFCNPAIDIILDLPCPVDIQTGSSQTVGVTDSFFFTEEPADVSLKERRWAFGQPEVTLEIVLGKIDVVETTCLPTINVSLNLPCPTTAQHRDPAFPVPDDADIREKMAFIRDSLIMEERSLYYEGNPDDPDVGLMLGEDASLHPYWDKMPKANVRVNQNLEFFDNPDMPTNPEFASLAHGAFGRFEADQDCNFDVALSLYIPCGKISPDFRLFDFDTGDLLTDDDGISVRIVQDWTVDPAGTGDCAFDEEIHLFMRPGGGASGKFARITGAVNANGTTTGPGPYSYSAEAVTFIIGQGWVTLAGGQTWNFGEIVNAAEYGPSGIGAKPLSFDNIVVVFQIGDIWAFDILHFRGVYA